MKKQLKKLVICFLVTVLIGSAGLLRDRKKLNEGLIRLHVVANSDSEQDQQIKLQVRDAVLRSMEEDLRKVGSVEEAREYLQQNLPKIQAAANSVLDAAGFDGDAVAFFCREVFNKRQYDTFSLPAGVYEALRITIGSGEGKNWWCVTFPAFCLPVASEGFEDVAVGAGFSRELCDTLKGEPEYKVRFYLLDLLGRLQNHVFRDEEIA